MILAQLQKGERTWEYLLAELGFKDNPKEKGKIMMDVTEQPIISPEKPVQTVENEERHTAEKTIQEGLCHEAS